MSNQNNTPPGPHPQPHNPRQQLVELVGEIRKITDKPKRATHIGFLLAMIYASLRTAEKEAFLDCLETIVNGRVSQ